MGRKRTYFVLNKEQDFQRCSVKQMYFAQGRLQTELRAGDGVCALVSRIFDSGETDMQWHQFLCSMENTGNTAFSVSVYTADSPVRQIKEKEEALGHILADGRLGLSEKKRILRPYLKKTMTNTADFLLHDVKGRYLWFILETAPQEGQRLAIEKIKIFFPAVSWLSYLPEIYASSDRDHFMERFLAIFQTMYESVNDAISDFPYVLDVDCAGKEYLEWLAGWLDLAESYMWTQEQLRRLLKHAVTLYRMRGTRYAVLAFVRLYTGDPYVYLVEHFQLLPYKDKPEGKLYERLYGNDPYRFQVLVRGACVPTVREYRTLMKMIREVKPAHMEAELVVLKPYIFLNEHTYLGLNSVLGEYRSLTLDGASMLPFSVLGEEEKRQ